LAIFIKEVIGESVSGNVYIFLFLFFVNVYL